MYIHMYIMAKTIMVSDNVYEKLKSIKEKENKSYSDVIIELVNIKKMKKLKYLEKFFGILKEDKEYDRIMKEINKSWDRWTKRYA